MTKTMIRKISDFTVALSYDDKFSGERVTREFWIPRCGGYVREGDQQVCVGLDCRGNTLSADDGVALLLTIRYHYYAMRDAEKREARIA